MAEAGIEIKAKNLKVFFVDIITISAQIFTGDIRTFTNRAWKVPGGISKVGNEKLKILRGFLFWFEIMLKLTIKINFYLQSDAE